MAPRAGALGRVLLHSIIRKPGDAKIARLLNERKATREEGGIAELDGLGTRRGRRKGLDIGG